MRGLNDEFKRRKFFNYFHQLRHSIILLQETYSTRKVEKVWRNEWGGNIVFAHYNSRSRGVAILIKKNVSVKIHNIVRGEDGRYIILDLTFNDNRMVLANVYGPNEDNPQFFVKVFKEVDVFKVPDKMIAGDFNVVLDPDVDRKSAGQVDSKRNSRQEIIQYMQKEELYDPWRLQHPEIFRYTCIKTNPYLSGSRIDYWLVSASMLALCDEAEIGTAVISDHAYVTLQIKDKMKRGKGYWKINNKILERKITSKR